MTNEIVRTAEAITSVMRLETSLRAMPSEILAQYWFQ
jgi:hypothetical protein